MNYFSFNPNDLPNQSYLLATKQIELWNEFFNLISSSAQDYSTDGYLGTPSQSVKEQFSRDKKISPSPEQRLWDYECKEGPQEQQLADLGKKGWELCAVITRSDKELWIFKRPLV